MFGLIDASQQTSQVNNNSSLPYLQNEHFEVLIGHGIARVKVVQHYLNFNQNEQAHLEFYFPQSKNLILESFLAELEQSKRNLESSLSSNLNDSSECKREEQKIAEKIGKNKFPNGILVDGWVRFKIAVVKPQESIIISLVYSHKLAVSREGYHTFQLPQQAITASYPISAKIHFEDRQKEDSITYHSLNHEVAVFQQPILLDNGAGQGLQHLSLRANYSHSSDKPFIINFFNKDYSNVQKIYLNSSLLPSDKQSQDSAYALVTIVPSLLSGVSCLSQLEEKLKHPHFNNEKLECIMKHLQVSKSQSEIIILLDRSSSMGSQKFSQAIEGISLLLRSLPTNSYFNIISQGSGNRLESVFESSVIYSQENLSHSINRINDFQNNLGTSFNILNSLKHIEGQKSIANYARQIVLISDPSELENKLEEIYQYLETSKLGSPIHTVNVESRQSSDSTIFEVISSLTGGNSISNKYNSNESITDSILKMLPTLFQPTLCNFELDSKASENFISQVIPVEQNLKSIQFNEQISLVLALKNTSKEQSLPLSFKFFSSALNKVEEHQIDLLGSQVEGSSHISNDLKKSLLKFCAHQHIISLKNKNTDEIKSLSLQYSVLAEDHTFWITKCYQLSENGQDKNLIAGQEQLPSIREKSCDDSHFVQQTRKVSATSNLMQLYDNQSGQENQTPSDGQERSKSQDLNNLIDAIFTGEPQKQPEQEQAHSKKSGSISSHGQNTDLLDIGDDVSQTTNPSQGHMSTVSNTAQNGDPNSDLNDDILDLIQNNNNIQQNNNQIQCNNGNAIDLLDDFLIGDSPSQSQSKSVSLLDILQNINYEGIFNSNKFILNSLLNENLDKFIGDKPENLTLDQWSTLLVLTSLEKNFTQEALKWGVLAKKGKEQLQKVLSGNLFDEICNKSKIYLK
ncbi:von willebrand factor type A domain protein (macronuclear) [Tetrahymena thermophila SB210]|uniref:von willebrand factor type A domain protein n=1 Tax=Tetrahymena thermophila (strain SB210) TaxID=312017 RepID=Q23AZ8_TETTS|nr:von willebrand factor type A domain protein [Tetrahymena thermophila SB210]EAR93686.1 von willebrand factor type A domain protein [Tetrahymena thermophila SB210]|eukprot:XP_001013931.1 von willebrand factor type A domain protein [Tetrahymena thermophila SB210]